MKIYCKACTRVLFVAVMSSFKATAQTVWDYMTGLGTPWVSQLYTDLK